MTRVSHMNDMKCVTYERGMPCRKDVLARVCCNTLQHTTHCSALQHTATHWNTLQQLSQLLCIIGSMSSHFDTLQRTAAHCSTLQHTATHRNSCLSSSVLSAQCALILITTTHCNTLQHTVTNCNTLQHLSPLYHQLNEPSL